MHTQNPWLAALEMAQRGQLDLARQTRTSGQPSPMNDYFYGRCLAEAGDDLEEAIQVLTHSLASQPTNCMTPQALALALARTGQPSDAQRAIKIWGDYGLPHDTDLLAQLSLTLEEQNRLAPLNALEELPWPEQLEKPAPAPPKQPEAAEEEPATGRDNLTHPGATKKLRFGQRRELNRSLKQMEKWLYSNKPMKILLRAGKLLEQEIECAELHLAAGIACEQLGDLDRARAHLGRAGQLDPQLLTARTELGRVWWRLGWFELAEALWRSLPVEGPYEYGRHYHLALAHQAQGRRQEALTAMRLALRDFFYDTRHYYIQQAYERWRASRPTAQG